MGLIEYYLIFALATGLAVYYDIMHPLIKDAKLADVENTFTKNTLTTGLIYITIISIIAPIMIIIFVVPSLNARYRESTKKLVHEKD